MGRTESERRGGGAGGGGGRGGGAGGGGGGGRSSDPFVQLERCHRRLEGALATLKTAAIDHDAESVAEVSSFFARQIRRHEEDEERSLFPRVRDADAPEAAELRAALERLSAEHRAHEAMHDRLEHLASGRDDDGERWSKLAALAGELEAAYRTHIEEEEARVFPAARALLTESQLASIRDEMEARRGR